MSNSKRKNRVVKRSQQRAEEQAKEMEKNGNDFGAALLRSHHDFQKRIEGKK